MPTMPRLPKGACCSTCGYSLRGLPKMVCPECGRGFDPDDLSSYSLRRSRIYSFASLGPPTRWQVVLALAILIVILPLHSQPGRLAVVLAPDFGYACLLMPIAILATVFLTVNYVRRVTATLLEALRSDSDRTRRRRRGTWRWFVLPICLLLLLSSCVTRWPLRLRFQASRSALENAARMHLDGTQAGTPPGRMGLYRFTMIHEEVAGVGFMRSNGFWRCCGFFYSPSDTPPTQEVLWSWRVAPNWYVFEWNF